MLKCPHGHDMRIRLPFSRPRPVWWPGVRWLPDAFRERAPVIPPAAGWDCHARAIGGDGLCGNIRSRIRESASVAVHGIRSLDPGILGEWNRLEPFDVGILPR